MTISVIIPVLNERQTLPATIAALQTCATDIQGPRAGANGKIAEIIVADGGSTDGTLEWLRTQPGLVLVKPRRGKGPQINAGAAAATGDVLLFLHADCVVSPDALDSLHAAMADTHTAGGAFFIRFAESRPRSLRFVAWGINLRARLRRSATGDQGIFVRKSVFHSVGGAPDWPLFEDVELVRRIKTAGKFVVLEAPLAISGRRYIQRGVLRTALLIYSLRFAYWLGVSPQRLERWFTDARHNSPEAGK